MLRGSHWRTDSSVREVVSGMTWGSALTRSTTGWRGPRSHGSTGLMANRRTSTPACSTRCSSLVMYVSERRGYAITTYATARRLWPLSFRGIAVVRLGRALGEGDWLDRFLGGLSDQAVEHAHGKLRSREAPRLRKGGRPRQEAVEGLAHGARGELVGMEHVLQPAPRNLAGRSEERRVGKECRSRGAPCH